MSCQRCATRMMMTTINRITLCYQFLSGYCDTALTDCFTNCPINFTRGNIHKLYINPVVLLIRCLFTKYYFTNRIISVWNSLPNRVVTAPTLSIFRRRIAKIDLSIFCVSF